jgi:transposase-like protein
MLILKSSFSNKQIKAVLRKGLFPKGRVICPHCHGYRIRKIEKRYYCQRCRKKFSLCSSSWLKNIRIPLKTLAVILESWLQSYSVKQTSKASNLSIPTIRRYFRLFRLNVVRSLEFKPEDSVQADEAYFGCFKKQANWLHGFKKYTVAEKTGVAGISCPATGQLVTKIIEGRPGKFVKEFIYQNVPPDITIYSDASYLYRRLNSDYLHFSMSHDRGFDYSYYIESCWSWMKRRLFMQYHHFTRKYAKEYIAELTWRFNTRENTDNPLEYLVNHRQLVPNALHDPII